jgi:hypothetical protein
MTIIVYEVLMDATGETEWDRDSQIAVLCDFIQRVGVVDPDLLKQFAAYIEERVADELDQDDRLTDTE